LEPTIEPSPRNHHGFGPAETDIHATAIVASSAVLGARIRIGPYAIVEDGVIVGDGCILSSHSIVRRGTCLGASTHVHSLAVAGGDPPDLGFGPAVPSGVGVGRNVRIREGVTIHRATGPENATVVGDEVLLMANSHVGHDSRIGARSVLVNNVMLGGHVDVGPYAVLGGGCGIHQFVRIGEGATIGGNAAISRYVPPFTMVVDRDRLTGLNSVGLRRRCFDATAVAELKRCYRAVYGDGGDPCAHAVATRAAMQDPGAGEEGKPPRPAGSESDPAAIFLAFF